MVRPRHLFGAEALGDAVGDLGAEAQMMDFVREGVRLSVRRVEVVVQIMHMHRSIAETASGRDMEVPHDFVDAKATFDAAALPPLRVQFLAVVLALALLDVFAPAKGPADAGVGFAHFLAGGAAAGFLRCGRGGGAVAVPAVVGAEVGGFLGAVEV